jgi:arylformamidase
MSRDDLNDAYEIDSKILDGAEIQARYAELSAAAAGREGAVLDVAYGANERQRLDVFAAPGEGCPAILFFHGGYWTGGAKESRRFPAEAWNARGVTWVPVEYRLTPAVTLDEVVNDARSAVTWFYANAARFGCDRDAIHVCGNSAGGHLVGMLVAGGWQERFGLPGDVIKSATAISGLFDLAPLRETFVNDWLRLDESSIARNSPIGLAPRKGQPIIVSWGGQESWAFHQQSQDYGDMCRRAGAAVSFVERREANHFTIIGELAEPESPLFAAMARQVADR